MIHSANQLAGFYTMQYFTERCFLSGYNFIYNFSLMQFWGVEIRVDGRSCEIIFI